MNNSYLLDTLKMIGSNWTAIGTFIAFIALVIGQWRVTSQNNSQQSLFYLQHIQKYFSDAISLLRVASNDNIKWHQAINCLEIVDDLKLQLKDELHQHIYLFDYINTDLTPFFRTPLYATL